MTQDKNTKATDVVFEKFGASDDIRECFTYLYQLKTSDCKTKQESAEKMGLSIRQIDYRIHKWQEQGIYEQMDLFLNKFMMASVEASINSVIARAPQLLEEMVQISLYSGRDSDRINAIKFIWEKVIEPLSEKIEKPGAPERAFIEARPDNADDPTSI